MPRCVSVHLAIAIMTLGACFSPDVTEGLACSEDGECPPGQDCDFDGICRAQNLPPDVDASADAAPNDDDAAVPAGFCDAEINPGLVGCYLFNGDADDSSGLDHHAQFDNQAYANGVYGQAFVFNDGTVMAVPENADFDAGTLTIEMWLRPDLLGVGDVNLIDNAQQYELELTGAGELRARCNVGGATTTLLSTTTLAGDVFTHVALVFDGTELILHIDGVADTSIAASGLLNEGGIEGTFIGIDHALNEQFNGRMDNLRVFDTARTEAQICESAGGSNC